MGKSCKLFVADGRANEVHSAGALISGLTGELTIGKLKVSREKSRERRNEKQGQWRVRRGERNGMNSLPKVKETPDVASDVFLQSRGLGNNLTISWSNDSQ